MPTCENRVELAAIPRRVTAFVANGERVFESRLVSARFVTYKRLATAILELAEVFPSTQLCHSILRYVISTI